MQKDKYSKCFKVTSGMQCFENLWVTMQEKNLVDCFKVERTMMWITKIEPWNAMVLISDINEKETKASSEVVCKNVWF